MYQVGTEGGFLPGVAIHDNTTPIPLDPSDTTGNTANADGPFNLLLAPAERADVVIDFNGVPAGTTFILYDDAPAPFPGGDPRNDYFTGDPDFTMQAVPQPLARLWAEYPDPHENCRHRRLWRYRRYPDLAGTPEHPVEEQFPHRESAGTALQQR